MFSNIRVRNIIYQVLLWVVVLTTLFFLINNASNNLVKQGIASGFAFLQAETGFDIASSLIEYNASSTYLRLFIAALLNTLLVSVISIIFATVIGFSVGIMRLSGHPIASKIATVYVEALRNIPLLLQVFFWYFAVLQPLPSPRQSLAFLETVFINNRGLHLPSPVTEGHYEWFLAGVITIALVLFYYVKQAKKYRITHGQYRSRQWWCYRLIPAFLLIMTLYFVTGASVTWSIPALSGFNFEGGIVVTPEFFALCLALSTYTGAYIAENVRSGIQSVEQGQIDAARALGLRPLQIMRLVIIPNAMRVIIPPLTNQYLTLTKNSSLAAAIAYPDIVLVFAGTALNQTGQAVEILLMVMLVYLLLSLVISVVMNLYNKRFLLVER